ncbi:MAG: hypothetical protein AB9836_03065 [Aminipila sp.]
MKKRSPIAAYLLTFATGSIYFFYWMFSNMRDINVLLKNETFDVKRKIKNLIVVFTLYLITFILISFGMIKENNVLIIITFIIAFSLVITWFVLILRYLRELSVSIASLEINNSIENPIIKWKTTVLFFLYFIAVPYIQIHMNRVIDNSRNNDINYEPKQEDKVKNKRAIVKTIVGICLGVLIFVSALAFGVMHIIKNSNSYQIAINYIEQTSEISDKVGGIKGYGLFPSASVEISNGYGTAQFHIKVLGNEKDLGVNLLLEKTPDSEWFVKDIGY